MVRFAAIVVLALSVATAMPACTSVESNERASKPMNATQVAWPDFMPTLQPAISASDMPAQLPSDVKITTPASDLPKAQALWSGIWSGWAAPGRVVEVALAIEQVAADEASIVVVRTVANQPRLEHRTSARFAGDELLAKLPSGTVMRYRLRDPNTIEFIWQAVSGAWMAGILTRSNPSARFRKLQIPTRLTEDSAPVSLEAVIYEPDGQGPFPTLVFNHGSTGTGNDPALFDDTWAEPNIGRHFTERGWMVVFPQRRGRGKSGGRYAEGLAADGSGYSIHAEVSLAGVDRALADLDAVYDWLIKQANVDADRLLIGGQSRGGILALAYLSSRPQVFLGAINFVGGWMGDRFSTTREINKTIFERAASATQQSLWLYADQDPFYSLEHSQHNFAIFTAAGGLGEFHVLPVQPGQNGHQVIADATLWGELVDGFIRRIMR